MIRFDFRVSVSFGAWFAPGSSWCGGCEASERVSWFRLGRLSSRLDDAIAGEPVDLFESFVSQSMVDSMLYEGERFEGRSVVFVVFVGRCGLRSSATPPPRENREVESL